MWNFFFFVCLSWRIFSVKSFCDNFLRLFIYFFLDFFIFYEHFFLRFFVFTVIKILLFKWVHNMVLRDSIPTYKMRTLISTVVHFQRFIKRKKPTTIFLPSMDSFNFLYIFFGFLIFYEHFFLRFCVFTVIKIYEKSDKWYIINFH